LTTESEAATARFQGAMEDSAQASGDRRSEEEDPERWDGMS